MRSVHYIAKYVMSMCVSMYLSVCEDFSGNTRAIITKRFVDIAYDRGSVLLRCRCDMLCTSSFEDDFMFFLWWVI